MALKNLTKYKNVISLKYELQIMISVVNLKFGIIIIFISRDMRFECLKTLIQYPPYP